MSVGESATTFTRRRRYALRLRAADRVLGDRTWVMGVLNVTPDSFSDGGAHYKADDAVAAGLRMAAAGADILDIGGESTRPSGAARVSAGEEIDRVLPVIEALRGKTDVLLSIDTTKAEVAAAALRAGADIVNDVSGLRFDPGLAAVAAAAGAPVILMHLRGTFETMHEPPAYDSVLGEVGSELLASLDRGVQLGLDPELVLLDPGIGFAKNAGHSLEVLRDLAAYAGLGRPLVIGPSRKSFIGKVLDLPVGERLIGTAAAVATCVLGGAHVVRVHDVESMIQVTRLCDAILAAGEAAGAP